MKPWSVLLAATLAPASGLAAGSPADPLAARVDSVFAQYTQPDQPGCALGVMREGRLVYSKGYGQANLEHAVPIDAQRTVFDIGSTSKQFTAAAVLLLAHDGKLSLDDDIRKYLPEVPDYGQPITIEHLLHHTSGLRDYTGLMMMSGWSDADYTTEDDALDIIRRQKALNFAPGSRHDYSNTGYFLLSLVVKRVSGLPLSQFAHDRLFAPLGMRDTLILDAYDKVVPHRATGYEPDDGAGFLVHMSDWQQTGDGAVQTTIADLARWDRQFYRPTVGGDWLVAQLQMPGTLADGSRIEYARGLFVGELRGLKTLSHPGSWAGFRSELLRFPEQRFSVATLCNRGDADPISLARSVAELYLGDRMTVAATPRESPAAPAKAATPLDPKRWVGQYFSADSGILRRIELEQGKLWYVRGSGSRTELAAAGDGRLRMLGVPGRLELILAAAGQGARRLQLDSDTAATVEFVEVAPYAPTAAQLAEFAGNYTSDELGMRWSLGIADGQLQLKAPREPARPLQPAFAGTFAAGPMLLRFRRDGEGRVTGFALDASRMRDIQFVRGD